MDSSNPKSSFLKDKRKRSEHHKAQKAERIACSFCGVYVRKDSMARHVKIKHIEMNELTPVQEILQKLLYPLKNQTITIDDLIEEMRILIEEIKENAGKIKEFKEEIALIKLRMGARGRNTVLEQMKVDLEQLTESQKTKFYDFKEKLQNDEAAYYLATKSVESSTRDAYAQALKSYLRIEEL